MNEQVNEVRSRIRRDGFLARNDLAQSAVLVGQKADTIFQCREHAEAYPRHLGDDSTDPASGRIGADDNRPTKFGLPQMFGSTAVEQIEISWKTIKFGRIRQEMNQRRFAALDKLRS